MNINWLQIRASNLITDRMAEFDNAANRIAITETARVQTEIVIESFKKGEYTKYIWIAAMDERTCGVCGPMDGKIFDIEGSQIGGDLPPMHPFCRCSVEAYFDDFVDGRRDSGYNNTISSSNTDISTRNPADGTGAGIYTGNAKLSGRQKRLLDSVNESGASITVNKRDIRLKDLSALTAATGDEIAMFTKSGERFIRRGNATNALLSEKELMELAKDGWRFSGHTHPGVGRVVRYSSDGDQSVLQLFNQDRSVILDSVGGYSTFNIKGSADNEN